MRNDLTDLTDQPDPTDPADHPAEPEPPARFNTALFQPPPKPAVAEELPLCLSGLPLFEFA